MDCDSIDHTSQDQPSWERHLKRLRAQGLWGSLSYYVFTVCFERLGIHIEQSYIYAPRTEKEGISTDLTFGLVSTMSGWTPRDLDILAEYGGETLLEEFGKAFNRGEWCAIARVGQTELACVCWIGIVPSYFLSREQPSHLIQRCFTLPAHRGKDIYPRTLAFACKELRSHTDNPLPVYIECSLFNAASNRGICKAGFRPAGRMLTVLGRKWQRPLAYLQRAVSAANLA